MKGRWVLDLLINVMNKEIKVTEAIGFAFARFRPKPTTFRLGGVEFKDADHTIWGIAWEVFLSKRYNPPGFEIGENDIVVDIGAHRGIFTAFAARRTKAKIIAVEPDPENFLALTQLVHANHWNQVVPVNSAVTPKFVTVKLYHSQSSSRHSITGIDPVNSRKLIRFVEVQGCTLQDLFQEIPTIHFLKIDCEGAEYEILFNSGDQLERVRRLSMELHTLAPGADVDGLVRFLRKFFEKIEVRLLNNSLGFLYATHNQN